MASGLVGGSAGINVVGGIPHMENMCVYHFEEMSWAITSIFDPDVVCEDQLAAARKFVAYPKGSKRLLFPTRVA